MNRGRHAPLIGLVGLLTLAGCAAETPPAGDGSRLALDVAALTLPGVGDVVWDLAVENAAGTVVWQRRVSSSAYGDGAGSASYVGPCDADPAVQPNTVKVWVVGAYTAPVSASGPFAAGAPTGVVPGAAAPISLQNPTATAPLARTFTCAANADTPVSFDVALMRAAEQGFFDVAVSFNDLFCSAKVDCCRDADGSHTCAADGSEDLLLLFDASGARARTFVLGFACTAGPGGTTTTALYLDDLALDCTPGGAFAADVTVDPDGPNGNQCLPGANGLTGCAPRVVEHGGFDADTILFQVGVYRGTELLTSGGAAAQKLYWNVALGARDDLRTCTLRTRGTADDASDAADGVDGGAVAAGTVYPYVDFDVSLATCTSVPLGFGTDSPVTPRYTATTAATDDTFAHVWSPGFTCTPACANGGSCTGPNACTCASGFTGPTCATDIDDCAAAPCLNGGTCADGVDSFTCTCASGYTGPTCATDIDECAAAPCLNGGTCTDGVGSFTCACTVGFGGTRCELATGELLIPAGSFYMGCSQYEEDRGWCPSAAELPRHSVTLSAFGIDRNEVTAGAYAACVAAGACTLPCSADGSCPALPGLSNATYGVAGRETHPINFVTWDQAAAFCAWGGKAVGPQRLCTEAEWERVARGGCETVGAPCEGLMRIYPWDDTSSAGYYTSPSATLANFLGTGIAATTSVGAFSPAGDSAYGAHDMAGNVWEWVADWYGAYTAAAATNPAGPASGTDRVLRGGGFGNDGTPLRGSWRAVNPPSAAGDDLGLRCCRTP